MWCSVVFKGLIHIKRARQHHDEVMLPGFVLGRCRPGFPYSGLARFSRVSTVWRRFASAAACLPRNVGSLSCRCVYCVSALSRCTFGSVPVTWPIARKSRTACSSSLVRISTGLLSVMLLPFFFWDWLLVLLVEPAEHEAVHNPDDRVRDDTSWVSL